MVKYPVARITIAGNEEKYVRDVIQSRWLSSKGPYEQSFENLFSTLHGAVHGIACSSGTTALTLALSAVGVRPGDEVIVPNFTMVASAWAVTYLGAVPKFVDCNERYLIDENQIIKKITNKTRAILPVHIYGRRCNMEAIKRIAHDYNLRIVEDSCEAHGIQLTGDIACFSFYGNKIISCGEGGMCVTNDAFFAEQLRHLRSMAFDENHTFLHHKLAYNFRMSAMQAAVGLAQTEKLDDFISHRDLIEEWYQKKLSQWTIGSRNVLWVFDIECHNRNYVRDRLAEAGIETRPFFKPMSEQPLYRTDENFPVSDLLSKRGFYLPVYSDMTEEDVCYISNAVLEFIGLN